MSDIKDLTNKIIAFRDERDWKQFHHPKDLAISLSLEASEVLEHFQWKTKEEIWEYVKNNKEEIGDELADVFDWVLLMAHDFGIDIEEAQSRKIEKNKQKYPVEKAKSKKDKYTSYRDD